MVQSILVKQVFNAQMVICSEIYAPYFPKEIKPNVCPVFLLRNKEPRKMIYLHIQAYERVHVKCLT